MATSEHPWRRRLTVLTAVMTLATTTGCQFGSLQFKDDRRLTFLTPKAREEVSTPLTVRWTMRGFNATGLDGSSSTGQGAFAVFVDRAPMPVGKSLKWLFRNDTGCKRDARCPSSAQLVERGVHVTTEPSVTVDVLPPAGDGVGAEQHYVNVVLIDGTGHRIGESGWYLPFQSKRRSA